MDDVVNPSLFEELPDVRVETQMQAAPRRTLARAVADRKQKIDTARKKPDSWGRQLQQNARRSRCADVLAARIEVTTHFLHVS
jgi:hypothetical protein